MDNPSRLQWQSELLATAIDLEPILPDIGRDQLICDPWHYLPILERKPGALRNDVPFQEWDLPLAIQRVRDCASDRL